MCAISNIISNIIFLLTSKYYHRHEKSPSYEMGDICIKHGLHPANPKLSDLAVHLSIALQNLSLV